MTTHTGRRRAGSATTVVLGDGRRVTLRLLTPADGPALVAALARADRWDLRRRFMGSPPPTSALMRLLDRADNVHDCGVGAFTGTGRLVGVAQFDRLTDAPAAEVAIEVAKDWQRVGLATALLERLADVARARGIRELNATYFADNEPVRRLLAAFGHLGASGVDDGLAWARIDLADEG